MPAHTPPSPHTRLPAALTGRRSILKGLAAAGLATAAPVLTACGPGGGAASGRKDTVSFGNNASDQVPKDAITAALKGFESDSGLKVAINTKQSEAYQEQITNYLQGPHDDVFAWFAGYRMRYFAQKGLTGDLSELWNEIGGGYSAALREAATGSDKKQYLVPFIQYPWAVFYRKSVWAQRGYPIPTTLDEYVALCERMKGDGLVPIAFAQKQGWPAMGTFDQLNLRVNGYRYHVDLMAGKENWQDRRVHDVFDTWRRLLPYHQENALGRDWQEAAQSLQQGRAGMYLLGSFIAQQFKREELDDLDFFPFPEINPAHGQESVEAPIDGYMISRTPKNAEGARKLLRYLADPQAQLTYLKSDPTLIAASIKADTSGYNALQLKAAKFIQEAKHITQFLDRDTDPRFASDAATNGLNAFVQNPNDVDTVLKGLADQAKTIFAG